jgi:UDP-GlcNAc:undecaprenyl-phosphate/decaprenyl-phosphate GlcNAc-1-phosphate transferase
MPEEFVSEVCFLLFPFLTSTVLTLAIEKFCRRIGVMDLPGKRKMQKEPIPRMGGLAFFSCTLVFCLALALPTPWATAVGACIIFAGGFLDDLTPANSVSAKLAFQIPGALLFSMACDLSHLPFGNLGQFGIRLLIFAFVFFMTNAANLMDNMNGLAAGLSVIITLSISAFSFFRLHDPKFAWIGLIVGSTVLGFCVRNFPLGKIYMGDQGSQFLGYFTSSYGILALCKATELVTPVTVWQGAAGILLLFSLFFWDVTSVTVIRLSEGRSPFVGDQCHISHRLARRGLSPTQTVLRLIGVQIVLANLTALLF